MHSDSPFSANLHGAEFAQSSWPFVQMQQHPPQQEQQHQAHMGQQTGIGGTAAQITFTTNNMAELALLHQPLHQPQPHHSLPGPPRQQPPSIKRPGNGQPLSLSFTSSSGSGGRGSFGSGTGSQGDPQMDEFLFDHICADFEEIVPDDLYQSVSRSLGIDYLSEASHIPVPQPIIQGSFVGASMRPFVSMVVKMDRKTDTASSDHSRQEYSAENSPFFFTTLNDAEEDFNPCPSLLSSSSSSSSEPIPRNVHFLYMAACPQTYLSLHVVRTLGVEDQRLSQERELTNDDNGATFKDPVPVPLLINGYPIVAHVSPAESHFSHLNILGQTFIRASEATVTMTGILPTLLVTFPVPS